MTETALEKRVLGLVYAARPEVMASLVKRCEQAGARVVALGPTALSSALPDDARFAILMDPPESLKARMRPPMTLLLLKGPVLNESSAEQMERFLLSVTESIEIVGPIKLEDGGGSPPSTGRTKW